MFRRRLFFTLALATVCVLARPGWVWADGKGQEDLDEALRVKVAAEDLKDLNKVIELLESSVDKGLDKENASFAQNLLSEALLERASQLTTVVRSAPAQNFIDPRVQRVRALAISDLRAVLAYENPPPQATAMLAQLLSMPGGDRREARRLLDKLFDQADEAAKLTDADRGEALALRATLQNDPDKALADFEAAIKLAPQDAELRLARAEFRVEHNQADEALADVNEVLDKHPDSAAAFLLQAQIYRNQKKLDESLASLAKAIELAPAAASAYQSRGEIYREQGEFAKAVEQFSKVLELQPGNLLALLHRAEAYLNNRQYKESLADVEAVLKAQPGLAVAHGLKAQVLAGEDKLGDAIVEMQKLAAAAPQETEYKMQLALYYLVNQQPRKAITMYSEVLSQDGDNFLALRSRADSNLNIGDHAAAVADFEKAIKLQAEDSALLNNFAWVLATSPDDSVRDGKRAVELAKKACELSEYKLPHILSTLAAAYAETGDFENARKWSQESVDLEKKTKSDEAGEPAATMEEELGKELASYKDEKPWRERQTVADRADSDPSDAPAKQEASPDAEKTPSSDSDKPAPAADQTTKQSDGF